MAVSEAHKKASNKWNSSKDQIMIRPEKADGERIRQAAADANVSVQKFILSIVLSYIDYHEKNK